MAIMGYSSTSSCLNWLAAFSKKYVTTLQICFLILSGFFNGHCQSEKQLNEISGYVSNTNVPLANVNVSVRNKEVRTITNENGYYEIKAMPKEVIQFSYSGMKSVEIVIEDITSMLNVRMVKKLNELGQVTIKTKKNSKDVDEQVEENTIMTAYGKVNKKSVIYGKIKSLKGNTLTIQGNDLIESLSGLINYQGIERDGRGQRRVRLVPNMSIDNPEESLAIWDIDGIIYEEPPNLPISEIYKVDAITSVAGTAIYGMRGSGGVIVVKTNGGKNNEGRNSGKGKRSKKKVSVPVYKKMQFRPFYLNVMDTIFNQHTLYEQYNQLALRNKNHPSFYIDMSDYFMTERKLDSLALRILSDAEEIFNKNPETLKAIAYTYQKKELHQKAIESYQRVLQLRPNYAQSYRDLASAYLDNKRYKKSWNTYLQYLHTGNSLYTEGIEKLVHSEMSFLYAQKKSLAAIRETSEIEELNLSIGKSDVRIVFEWNTSEAEFEIEFVDPQSRSFTFDHSLEKTPYRIIDEKEIGYSCNEFYFYNLTKGDWYVNIKYFGNKKYEPTYIKTSIYRNWGRANQTQEIKLFRLKRQNYKMQLLKLNLNSTY